MNQTEKKKLKLLALEQLNKTPIIQVVCEKIGLPRTTFYRWKEKDEKFSETVDKAMFDGRHLINDFAESQLLNAIKNNNLTAIIYWLNHNHKNYTNKLEINGKFKTDNGRLTPEQETNVKQALELASLFGNNNLLINKDCSEEKNISSEL
jgi:hypothetical protein